MKPENPNDDHGPEATYARKRGWEVVYEGDVLTVLTPPGVYADPKLKWTFRTIPGAWGAAAQRAGYTPIADAKAAETTRPGSVASSRKGRPPS